MTASEEPEIQYSPPRVTRMSAMAIAAFVLGFFAVPLDFVYCSGAVLGLFAMALGFGAIRQINAAPANGPRIAGKGFAIAGIILGALSLLLAIGCGVMVLVAFRAG